jgi:hypothetical protein
VPRAETNPYADIVAALRRFAARCAGEPAEAPGFWLGRFVLLRLVGVVYLMAFLTLLWQGPALIGNHGLEPAAGMLDDAVAALGSRAAGFWRLPSLFWLGAGDTALRVVAGLGIALALVVIGGFANAIVLAALCALQISIVHVGGAFYAFGWEIQLVETGFLCIFLCPLLDGRPFPARPPPPALVWLLRWLIARIMWGAGLIKLRGDTCWRDLSCLDFHFETQPIPSPLSPWFHHLPHGAHVVGVVFNHAVELAVPFLIFGPRRVRHVGGALLAALQIVLIASGNLSFLNWLTLAPIVACFDDGVWRRLLPRALVARAERARAAAAPSRAAGWTAAAVTALVAVLSVPPMANLLSGRQVMNTSFTRLPLVNTYGAFGSVGRERTELIIEGTNDDVVGPETKWQAYEWKCKPGDPARAPCWMSPYHRRLDWLIWFAAMGTPREYPWAIHLVWKLLHADRGALGLLASDPFGGARPRFIRIEHYRYRFAPRGAPAWWQRERIGSWLPALEVDSEGLPEFLRRRGWLDH